MLVLKLAQLGLLVILNVRPLPSGSLAVGVKEYAWFSLTDVEGVPVIVGASLTSVILTVIVLYIESVLDVALMTMSVVVTVS